MKTILKKCVWLLSFVFLVTALIGCSNEDPVSGPIEINEDLTRIEGYFAARIPMTEENFFVLNLTGGTGTAIVRTTEVINGMYIPPTTVTLLPDGSVRVPILGTPQDPGMFLFRVEVLTGYGEWHRHTVPHFVEAPILVGFPNIEIGPNEGFDGGLGFERMPWLISQAEQLDLIRNHPDAHFLLTADVNLADLEGEWVPIPALNGSINGDGHSVYGLVHENFGAGGGFITELGDRGALRNIAFRDINMTTTGQFGAIIGTHFGVVDNIVVTGSLTSITEATVATGRLGGISGMMSAGALTNAYIDLTIVSNAGMTGGAVGLANNSALLIANVTARGSITITRSGGTFRVGGILARAEGSSVLQVRNNLVTMDIGAVEGHNIEGVGGIFGACNNPAGMLIIENKFEGTLTNVRQAGGISGAGPNVRNNLVVGRGMDVNNPTITVAAGAASGAAGAIAGQGKFTLYNNIARDVTITGAAVAAAPMAGAASNLAQNVRTRNNVIMNTLLNSPNVAGMTPGGALAANNYSNFRHNMQFFAEGAPSAFVPVDDANGVDGANVATVDQAFLEGLGFNFTTVWEMRNGVPYLRNVGFQGNMVP